MKTASDIEAERRTQELERQIARAKAEDAKSMKKKPKTKTKPKAELATLWAIKKPKAKSPPAFMPDEVAVLLEGDKGLSGFLGVTGWSVTPSPSSTWACSRLETNYDRLCRDWASEIGKGWRLEIRKS